MNFTQLEFLIFLVVVIVAVWASPSRRSRNLILLVGSYYFYAYWDVRFCLLLIASTMIDYGVAHQIQHTESQIIKRRWLLVSLTSNLGMLAFFKYFNFFLDSARPILVALGATRGGDGETWTILLPVGISFFTFQTLSYTIDVFRGKIRCSNQPLDFALYVAFFPQLVAGPIVRAANLLPQLVDKPVWSNRRFYGGAQQCLRGAVKKCVIADRLAETVDVVFAGPELYAPETVWLAVIAYAGQIYYDFSGYSDMAIGIAKMLGYRFPVNFRHPYLATSLTAFWRRWHITLSTWLRDYLYIPLGGSRGNSWSTNCNLIITMTLGGLWHGAAFTFVCWGIWHGLALVIERLRRGWIALPIPFWLGWLMTIFVVLIGWVFFRARDISDAMVILSKLVTITDGGIAWWPPLTLIALLMMFLDHLLWSTRWRRYQRLPADAWPTPIATALLIWSLLLFAPRGFRPFVYFQF